MNGKFIRTLSLCFLATLALTACQTSGALESAGATQVTKVEVSSISADGTVNLPEDVRVKTLREAYRYSQEGAEKTLKVQIDGFHVKNPIASLLVGDNNRLSAKVEVIDKSTGAVDAKFNSIVTSKSVLNGISGVLISAAQNPIEVEQQLASALAERILVQVYGPALGREAAARTPTKTVTPNYPRDYADLKVEFRCRMLADAKTINEDNPSLPKFDKIELPAECKTQAASRS